MEISKVYPLDAVFDSPDDVPEDVIPSNSCFVICIIKCLRGEIMSNVLTLQFGFVQIKTNKRYAGSSNWTVQVCIHFQSSCNCAI